MERFRSMCLVGFVILMSIWNPVLCQRVDLNQKGVRQVPSLEAPQNVTGTVYRGDLQGGLHYILFQDYARDFVGVVHTAALKFVKTLKKFYPFREDGRKFINELEDFFTKNTNLAFDIYLNYITDLSNKYSTVLSNNSYVNCQSSDKTKRGSSCGIWLLFHFMLTESAKSLDTNDPLEVLNPIAEFMEHISFCKPCKEHFAKMVKTHNMTGVPSKDQAILWLWKMHNIVNERLKNIPEATDPEYPKVQFPLKTTCPRCVTTPHGTDSEWNEYEVLKFLKHMYSREALVEDVVNRH